MKSFASLIIILVLTISVGVAQPDYSFKEKYKMALPAKLKISSSDGNINVVPTEGSEIEVFYIVKKSNSLLKISRQALEKELTLTVTHSGNNLEILVKYPNTESWFKSMDRMYINFEIHVPKETASNLHSSDGNISLTGLTGNQQIKTSDGNISITKIVGDVTGNTSDGDVRLEEIKGSADAGTSDGNITADGISGDLRTSTSDGNIEISRVTGATSAKTSDGYITFRELSGSFTGITSDGNIRGNLVKLQKELTARTGDGNIDITIPDKLGLDLDIKGESLHVPLDNFSGRSDEKIIQGKSNGGGIPVNLSTSDGNIRLTYR